MQAPRNNISNALPPREYEDGVDSKFSMMSSKAMETRYYEGCGREGPIRCIFLGEFHPVAGPKISCQFPEDYVSKELFDTISAYIIPKPLIQKCTMTINALGHKIIGYPIRIDNSKYDRNVYVFNLCFVLDSWSKTVQYEPVVKKLGEHLTIMEEETRFVSSGSSKLPTLLAHLLHDLNTHRKATLVEGDTVMHLKVLEVRKDPTPVHDHDVPVLVASVGLPRPGRVRPQRQTPPEGAEQQNQEHLDVEDEEPFEVDMSADWDLTTRQLLPYINGYNHVSKIAADTNVEKTLVKSCIQNLVYYGVVTLIPVLKFSNMYRATPNLSRLFSDGELQKSCISFITKGSDTKDKPTLSDVLEILCSLQQGTTLRAVCERYATTSGPTFDIRRLVVFAQLHGLIKCLKRYPVYIRNPPRPNGFANRIDSMLGIRRLFTGKHCTDEICCIARIDLPTLDQIIEDDPNVSVIWRCIAETLWLPRPARRRERHPACGKSPTKLRSRSSPVRLGSLPAWRRRQRSPTVSPPQPSLHGSPFSNIDDLCYYINQESKVTSRKSAYFSKRPPGEPLRVVVLSRDKLNTSNIFLPPPPYTDASPSPPPKAHRSRTRQRQNEDRRASCHVVQGLLTDLTDNLPLVPPAAPLASSTRHITRDQKSYDVTSNTKGAAIALAPLKLRRHRHRVSSAKTGNVKVVPDGNTDIPGEIADLPVTDVPELISACRNVAVQARTRSRSTLDNTTKAAREAQVETEVAPAAVWMGDVRALRDSHVRLVRRQLRHIAQLNRALDYARYPQSTTPPQPSLLHGQTQSAQSSLPTQPTQFPETRPLQSSQSSQLIQSAQTTQQEKSRRPSKAKHNQRITVES